VHDEPPPDGRQDEGWPAADRGGLGVLLVVSHSRPDPPVAAVDGVMASLGDPPRGFTSLVWWGRHLPAPVAPMALPGSDTSRQSRWSSPREYADQIIKALAPQVDDVAVGVLYVIGA
jgi:hypothetical protein